jgi:hypothetical protein
VTSVDAFEPEIAVWKRLTAGVRNLDLQVRNGRELPFGDAPLDHAYTISVVEHISEDGDLPPLVELARRQARRTTSEPGGFAMVVLRRG